MRIAHRSMRITIATVLSLGLLLCFAVSTAFAHAKVISATPGIGSTIAQAPTVVSVKTAENMKPGATNSNLFVYGPDGALVSQGDATIPLNDPMTMSINITPEKAAGAYVVRWITVSADDGDPDQGAFIFTVNPSAAATPAVVPPKSATTSPTAGTSGTPLWVAIATGIVALLVGLAGGIGLGRRRSTAARMASTSQSVTEREEPTPKS